jgi:putative CocE/NonD family hydrolase
VRVFEHLQNLGVPDQYLIVAPGPHCSLWRELVHHLPVSELKKWAESRAVSDISKLTDFDPSALKYGDLGAGDVRYRGVDLGYGQLFLRWFEKWVAGDENGVTEMPRVQLLVINQGWISGPRWPLPETQMTPYYLAGDPEARLRHENGILSTQAPAAAGSESFVYDPGNPVPTCGGGCCDPAVALDQRPVEARRDVLVFSTPPLEDPVTIAGPIEVVLYVSSSARDTDFIVKLVDVYPDGKAINLNDDGFRVRYRQGFETSVPMEAGQIYRITLPNMVAGNRFLPGHRIRLDITSSCFPLYERNLNTGGDNFDETEWVVAENTVHLGGDHASHVVLPLLPG